MKGVLQMADYKFKPFEDLPEIHDLPDPFIGPDGKRITSKEEWPKQREYLLSMLDYYLYGPVPPTPASVEGELLAQEKRFGGNALFETIKLNCDNFSFTINVMRPNKPGKFPAICYLGMPVIFGSIPVEWEAVCDREYVLATYAVEQIAPDRPEGGGPLYEAYPGWEGKTIMAWSWGIMRIIDYLLKCDYIDEDKIVVTGCSRMGKTALCAAIHDTRVALAGIAGSGCGGLGCLRILGDRHGPNQNPKKVETMGSMMRAFPHWFSEKMLPFCKVQPPHEIKNEYRLPFDMHFARALMAPRPLIATNALGDDWGNLYGDYITYLAAEEVYDFLDAKGKTAFFYREGPHYYSREEWLALLDFADYQFFGKKSPGLDLLNKPIYEKVYRPNWRRP